MSPRSGLELHSKKHPLNNGIIRLHPLKHHLENGILKWVKLSWERVLWSGVGLPLWLPRGFPDSIKSKRNGNSSCCSKLCDQSCHTAAPKFLSRNSEQSLQKLLSPAKSLRTYELLEKGKVWNICAILQLGSWGWNLFPGAPGSDADVPSCGRKCPQPALAPGQNHTG